MLSSIEQVLLSIQSMVFCETPWLNEPGHQVQTANDRACAQDYNRAIR